jgi:hypothetical protein
MSFTGDLEHLPIVDVIQLLYSTRKSGILRIKCRKGESELVFKDGFIVSASHLNNSIRIGTLLVNMNFVTQEALDQALQHQKSASGERKPLIVTLLELGLVNEHDAYKGLEHLIEMTIVEILTWKKGTFRLDVLVENIADEYRYYPGQLSHEINIDTQSILMDALRIFDEKVRDGEISVEDDSEEDFAIEAPKAAVAEQGSAISADDLGLADLDQIEKKIPKVFKGLAEFDPSKIHRQKLEEFPSGLTPAEQEELITFLAKYTTAPNDAKVGKEHDGQGRSILFYSTDELFMHAVTTVCKYQSLLVFATNEEQNIVPIITQSMGKNIAPLLVLDAPEIGGPQFTADKLALLRQQITSAYEDIVIIQLITNYDSILSLYNDGVTTVIPRPDSTKPATYLSDTINFLGFLPEYLNRCITDKASRLNDKFHASFNSLQNLKEVPEIAMAILNFAAEIFPRSVTLIVKENELIAEKGIGIKGDKSQGASPPLGFKIPLDKSPLLKKVIDNSKLHYGIAYDEGLKTHLYSAITPPLHPYVLLLPIKNNGKTIALIYADFGADQISTVAVNLLETMEQHAEVVLSNAVYRKKAEKKQ